MVAGSRKSIMYYTVTNYFSLSPLKFAQLKQQDGEVTVTHQLSLEKKKKNLK
jgi:hypothetical protein